MIHILLGGSSVFVNIKNSLVERKKFSIYFLSKKGLFFRHGRLRLMNIANYTESTSKENDSTLCTVIENLI